MEIIVQNLELFGLLEAGSPRLIETAPLEEREFDYDGLIRPMEPRIMRSIWRIVRHKETAEDALQNALTAIWKKRGLLARHPNPQALILKIAIDAAYDAVRKSRRRARREIPGLPEQPVDASVPPPSKDAEDRDLRADILAAIGRLPKRQAAAVLLRVIEDRSYAEIAQGMGCAEATVRIHVMRAKAVLARRLAHLLPGPAGGVDLSAKETKP